MLIAYLNFPQPEVTEHRDLACTQIGKMQKTDQRRVPLTLNTLADELRRFERGEYRFAPDRTSNDMYLEIDFQDPEFESALLRHIHRLISRHHPGSRFARVQVGRCSYCL